MVCGRGERQYLSAANATLRPGAGPGLHSRHYGSNRLNRKTAMAKKRHVTTLCSEGDSSPEFPPFLPEEELQARWNRKIYMPYRIFVFDCALKRMFMKPKKVRMSILLDSTKGFWSILGEKYAFGELEPADDALVVEGTVPEEEAMELARKACDRLLVLKFRTYFPPLINFLEKHPIHLPFLVIEEKKRNKREHIVYDGLSWKKEKALRDVILQRALP